MVARVGGTRSEWREAEDCASGRDQFAWDFRRFGSRALAVEKASSLGEELAMSRPRRETGSSFIVLAREGEGASCGGSGWRDAV